MVNRSNVIIQNIDFNTGWDIHMYVASGSTISIIGNYKISASPTNTYITVSYLGVLINNVTAGITVTITGTPNWPTAFIAVDSMGYALVYAARCTFSGAAKGKRYDVTYNAYCKTVGGGASYFPGNAEGTTGTGGLYT